MKVLTTVELMLNGAPAAQVSASTPAPAAAAPSAVLRPQAAAINAPALVPAAPALATLRATQQPVLADRMSSSPTALQTPRTVVAPATASKPISAAPAARAVRSDVRLGSGDFSNSRDENPVLGGATRPMSVDDDQNVDHILVVDDSDIALKFMRNRLTRFGFRTDLVNSGEEALGRMNVRPYKFVFLDVMMEGLDGYQTCRAIKQRKYSEGKPPVVVMLTSRGGTIDKIRGTLAGCDAYLTKPLNERDLIAVLAKHDRTVARGFQQTNYGASVKSGFGAAGSR